MRKLRLSAELVTNWLSGIATFVMAFCIWWAWDTGSYAPIGLGWMGGTMLLLLGREADVGLQPFSRCVLWALLTTLSLIATNMALASLGICPDAFGLLN